MTDRWEPGPAVVLLCRPCCFWGRRLEFVVTATQRIVAVPCALEHPPFGGGHHTFFTFLTDLPVVAVGLGGRLQPRLARGGGLGLVRRVGAAGASWAAASTNSPRVAE